MVLCSRGRLSCSDSVLCLLSLMLCTVGFRWCLSGSLCRKLSRLLLSLLL